MHVRHAVDLDALTRVEPTPAIRIERVERDLGRPARELTLDILEDLEQRRACEGHAPSMLQLVSELHEQNRRSWNYATRAHNAHKGDQAAFLRGGGSTLFPEELELLGDVGGKRVVHLQCNAGQDSLSIAARGAHVTGVDISDEAIGFARTLSAESGIAATFERADVFDWLASAAEQFDIAFASYGALCWLSDVPTWARGVARVLAPGG